jgi:hypothetical protein
MTCGSDSKRPVARGCVSGDTWMMDQGSLETPRGLSEGHLPSPKKVGDTHRQPSLDLSHCMPHLPNKPRSRATLNICSSKPMAAIR